jgi:hypothetical protein
MELTLKESLAPNLDLETNQIVNLLEETKPNLTNPFINFLKEKPSFLLLYNPFRNERHNNATDRNISKQATCLCYGRATSASPSTLLLCTASSANHRERPARPHRGWAGRRPPTRRCRGTDARCARKEERECGEKLRDLRASPREREKITLKTMYWLVC